MNSKIVGLELLNDRITLLLGRWEDVNKVFSAMSCRWPCYMSIVPTSTMHFQDYPAHIQSMKDGFQDCRCHAIHTQSKEYVDCLLESDMEFGVATVREVDGQLRIRHLSKEEARYCRETFCMELRA